MSSSSSTSRREIRTRELKALALVSSRLPQIVKEKHLTQKDLNEIARCTTNTYKNAAFAGLGVGMAFAFGGPRIRPELGRFKALLFGVGAMTGSAWPLSRGSKETLVHLMTLDTPLGKETRRLFLEHAPDSPLTLRIENELREMRENAANGLSERNETGAFLDEIAGSDGAQTNREDTWRKKDAGVFGDETGETNRDTSSDRDNAWENTWNRHSIDETKWHASPSHERRPKPETRDLPQDSSRDEFDERRRTSSDPWDRQDPLRRSTYDRRDRTPSMDRREEQRRGGDPWESEHDRRVGQFGEHREGREKDDRDPRDRGDTWRGGWDRSRSEWDDRSDRQRDTRTRPTRTWEEIRREQAYRG